MTITAVQMILFYDNTPAIDWVQWSRDNDAYKYKSAALNVRLCLTFFKFLHILERELDLRSSEEEDFFYI